MNQTHDLAAVDLNLLVAFQALHETRSVTHAAARLGVTQSAMSHTLRRLRNLTGDTLFVRQGRSLAPTPRADAMIGPVRHALHQLAHALNAEAFQPETSRRTFRLASVDLFDLVMLPAIVARLAAQAPGVGLTVVPHGRASHEALHAGGIDAAIHPVLATGIEPLPPAGLVQRTLLREGWRLYMRRDHPVANWDLDAYARAAHLVVSPDGSGPTLVDAALAALGRTRHVAVRVPHFAATLPLVARTDLVLTGPASLADLVPDTIRVVEVPVEVPGHAITLVWSERFADDPGHRWFREQVVAATRVGGLGG